MYLKSPSHEKVLVQGYQSDTESKIVRMVNREFVILLTLVTLNLPTICLLS